MNDASRASGGRPSVTVVAVSLEDLEALIARAVRSALDARTEVAEWLSIEEVAELLGGVHPRTVRNWVNRDGLPASRTGNFLRFNRAKVIAWIEQRAATPGVQVNRAMVRLKRARSYGKGTP